MFQKSYLHIYVKVSQLITDFDSTFTHFFNFLICCSSLVTLNQVEHNNIAEYVEESSNWKFLYLDENLRLLATRRLVSILIVI